MNLQKFIKDTIFNGGASYNIYTGDYNPNKGYMLAIKGHELQIPLHQFNSKVLSDYIKTKADILLSGVTENKFLGSWVDNGVVYLDCSVCYDSAVEAIQIGIDSNELAIWDNQLKCSIPCNELALKSAKRVDEINNI